MTLSRADFDQFARLVCRDEFLADVDLGPTLTQIQEQGRYASFGRACWRVLMQRQVAGLEARLGERRLMVAMIDPEDRARTRDPGEGRP